MKRALIGFFVGSSLAVVLAQTVPAPLQLAITQLTTGVTPFTTVGMLAGSYINFGVARSVSGYGIRDNAGTIQIKNSGGAWATPSAGNTSATYLLQVATGGLPNAQAIGALSSGLLIGATGTGVVSAYAGTTCTNQFVRVLSSLGVATCASINMATDTTGAIPNTRGGTGQDSSAWTALPTVTAGVWGQYAGTSCTNQVLTVLSAVGVGTCATLTSAYVNTSIAVTGVDLNTSSQVTATHLSSPLPVAQGGTALASYTVGMILYASGATTISGLTDVATGSYLRSGGAATAPSWSTVTLPNTSTTGDLWQASASNTMSALTAVASGSYLRAGGIGTASLWSTVTIPNTSTTGDLWQASASNVMSPLLAVASGSYLRSAGIGAANIWSTLTLPNAATQGDVLVATAANTVGNLSDVSAGAYLRSGGVSATPLWSTLTLLNTTTANNLMFSSATNTMGQVACATAGTVLQGGNPPVCTATPSVTSLAIGGNTTAAPILLNNSTAYTTIASTNAETYFAIGSDGLIPAGAINAPKHRINIVLRGIYGTLGATDSLILKVKFCTVVGCGSGTVTVLGTTSTIVPGAAVASQGWETTTDVNVFTAGAPGTVDAQGFALYALTGLTAAQPDDMPNSATISLDTTVNQYVAASVTFNNVSASNTIQLRNFAAYVY